MYFAVQFVFHVVIATTHHQACESETQKSPAAEAYMPTQQGVHAEKAA